jgi:hypothetical protein
MFGILSALLPTLGEWYGAQFAACIAAALSVGFFTVTFALCAITACFDSD